MPATATSRRGHTSAADTIATMDLRELRTMTREQVEALPDDARQVRRTRLLTDPTTWGTPQIVTDFGLRSRHGVLRWRRKYLDTATVSAEAMPPPDPELSDPTVKQPGDTSRHPGGHPRWRAGVIRTWGVQTGRLDEDLFPREGGRKPPGRPPKQRDGDE